MTAILGISAFYHDSAAALVVDGRIVAAAQEERFTRRKHDPDFPQHAIDYCLREAGLQPGDLDCCGVLRQTASEIRSPAGDLPGVCAARVPFVPGGDADLAADEVALAARDCAAACAASIGGGSCLPITTSRMRPARSFPSPFDEAAILTVDGVGEWATASYRTRARATASS